MNIIAFYSLQHCYFMTTSLWTANEELLFLPVHSSIKIHRQVDEPTRRDLEPMLLSYLGQSSWSMNFTACKSFVRRFVARQDRMLFPQLFGAKTALLLAEVRLQVPERMQVRASVSGPI